MTKITALSGDCSRCVGLCCVMLSFERGAHFAFHKPAGESCPQLSADHRCRIHHRLALSGMTGCVRYDCLGAGQLVTAMFRGLAPLESPAVGRAMSLAFARTRDVQALRGVLRDACIATEDAASLEADLAAATASYAALLQLDLAAARRAAAAIVRGSAGSA